MKKILIVCTFLFVTLYSIAWVSSIYIYSQFSKNIVNVQKEIPTISGFPFWPQLIFTGDYHLNDGSQISTSGIIISGFPFPAQRITITAANGLTFKAPLWVTDIAFHQLDAQFQIPLRYPRTNKKEDWLTWQRTGDSISIDHVNAQIDQFQLTGTDGTLQLDTDLKWTGSMTIRLTGADQFVMHLSEQGMIPPQAAIAAQSFLQFLTRQDDVTGERYIVTSLQIRKNNLFIGPIKLMTLPTLNLQ